MKNKELHGNMESKWSKNELKMARQLGKTRTRTFSLTGIDIEENPSQWPTYTLTKAQSYVVGVLARKQGLTPEEVVTKIIDDAYSRWLEENVYKLSSESDEI